jgi:hypothetical protein
VSVLEPMEVLLLLLLEAVLESLQHRSPCAV